MLKILKKIFSILFDQERRRAERIPCKIRAHFAMIDKNRDDRGEGTITDITLDGFCCDDMHFFRHDPNFAFKINHALTMYFTLPIRENLKTNFEVVGKIRSIMEKDKFGHSKRFGIRIYHIKKGSRKEFHKCFAYIKTLAKNNTPYQQF
jgi:hypothetical protein